MTGQGTLGEVWDGSGDPREGPGRVGGPSGRSRKPSVRSSTGRRTLWEVRKNLGEVQDGSREPRGGPGRVGEPSGRSEMGWGTLWVVRGTLGEV